MILSHLQADVEPAQGDGQGARPEADPGARHVQDDAQQLERG